MKKESSYKNIFGNRFDESIKRTFRLD